MPGELLRDTPTDGVLRLAISHPAKRGALDHAILDAVAAAVQEAERPGSGVRAILLTGVEGQFSAGYDIGDIPADVFAERAEKLVAHPFTAAIDALEATDLPTVAALPGHAIGGGLELALVCDLRIAAEDVRLGMPPAKLGLVYSHTGLRRFVAAIGAPRTRELFLLGRYVDAPTAAAWGLVSAVAPAARLAADAVELAAELGANSPLSVRGNKRILRELAAADTRLDADVEAELVELRRACFRSDDMAEGVRAFGEKRAPVWRGR